MTRVIHFVALLFMLTATTIMAQEKVPQADSPDKVKPGETALLTTNGKAPSKYFLRVPKSYDKEKGARLIIFMHGSNMNGLTYLRSIEARKWCKDDILVCPNGERASKKDDPYAANNFTFSAANYVSELTKEMREAFNTTRCYIGGHSQGGFVTYSCIMHFPDLYDGAFPMAGDCWMQNEPNLWEGKPEIVAKQKRIPIAVIHGQRDPVVSYSQGEHAYGVFQASNYPKLRFFNPKRLGHEFMLSPVDDALEWLDAMNGANPQRTMELTKKWGKEKEWGWAHQAAMELLKDESIDAETKAACEKIGRALEVFAKEEVEKMTKAMDEEEPRSWIPKWYEFHRQYGATKAAKELVNKYNDDRKSQSKFANELFNSGYMSIRQSWNDKLSEEEKKELKDDGYAKLEQLLEEAPCTFNAYYAMSFLKSRDEKK